jgi:uncharacterized protein (TIGR01777 family)
VRVLVTGATGLIGSALCEALLARGDEVAGLSRDAERARAANPEIAWHAWNPAEERPPEAAFAGVDAVVNLVGENINQRLTDGAKARVHDSRVRATKNLVDSMLAASPPPGVLISQNAVGYYGDRGEEVVDESTPHANDWVGQMCAAWEQSALTAAERGIRVVVLRSGLVLDPDGGLLKQLLLPFKLGVGGPLAGGRQYMPWIHRDDEVGAILWALREERAEGPINSTAPNPVTNREFSKTLGKVLHRPSIAPVPRLALVAIRGEELTEQIVSSLRVVPRRAQELGYSFRFSELEPALRDLLGR